MDELIQLIMAFFGGLGFSMLFHQRPRLWILSSFSSMMSWGIYLIATKFWDGIFIPTLVASAVTAFYGEVLARLLKAPSTVFFVPCLIPLIPGGSLYRMMSCAVRGDWVAASDYSSQTMFAALAIAMGGSLAWAVCIMASRIRRRYFPRPGEILLIKRAGAAACACGDGSAVGLPCKQGDPAEKQEEAAAEGKEPLPEQARSV